MTRKWYTTLRHPKIHPHIKFGIPTSKNIGDMHRTRSETDGRTDRWTDIVITIKTKSEVKVKVTVTRKWYATLHHPKIHPHTKFEIPTSKNIGDMHRTRSGTEGQTVRLLYASQSSFGGIKTKTLIGQPRDAQPELRLYCSHRYKAVFFTICSTYSLVLGGPQHHTIGILLICKTKNRLTLVDSYQSVV